MKTEELYYWMWLQRAVGQGGSLLPRLLKAFSSPEEIYHADRAELSMEHIGTMALDALCDKSLEAVKHTWDKRDPDDWVLTMGDPAYPELLHRIFSPPLVLYGRGKLPSWTRRPSITIVGTRKCTRYGSHVAGAFAAGLAAAGCPIISGGAEGIDTAAHEGALYGGGVTVAVQACGLDICYPVSNAQLRWEIVDRGGAVISEYPYGQEPDRSVFQMRNRIMSALGWGTCVIEAPIGSGALITARRAREQNKDVYVVPGNITSKASIASNQLIREGAAMVTLPGQILEDYQDRFGGKLDEGEADTAYSSYLDSLDPMPPKPAGGKLACATRRELPNTAPASAVPCPDGVSEDCRRIYEALGEQPLSSDQLFEKTGLPLNRIFSSLTELEVYGCIRSYPGQHYSR